MASELLQYDRMVEEALREVIRVALSQVARHGLPGNHHFYVTFRTDYPGVEVAEHLRKKHPQEMTIVIQHQFWGLEVGAASFEVTLTFNKLQERLIVPFAAVTGFSDPAGKFGLQFRTPDGIAPLAKAPAARAGEGGGDKDHAAGGDGKKGGEGGGEVITLDTFRKNTRKN